MKRTLIIVGILFAVVGIFIFTSPESDDTKTTSSNTSKPTFQSIQSDVKNGAYLIDVRTPEEYQTGHFASAINFDSVDIDAGKTPNIPKNAKIFLYCRTGHRAGNSLAKLKAAGFTNVNSLGGLEDVKALGSGELIK